jgi:hypothetical protein
MSKLRRQGGTFDYNIPDHKPGDKTEFEIFLDLYNEYDENRDSASFKKLGALSDKIIHEANTPNSRKAEFYSRFYSNHQEKFDVIAHKREQLLAPLCCPIL